MTGLVFSIERYAIEDGPGIRTLIFLKGCPLNCEWCANPESHTYAPEILYYRNKCASCGRCVVACPQDAIRTDDTYGLVTDPDRCTVCGVCVDTCYYDARAVSGKDMSVSEVMQVVLRDRLYYQKSGGGVTFSGGEPLMQAGFVRELVAACKAEGIHTAIETTLCVDEKVVTDTLADVDLIFVDVKLLDADAHFLHTGMRNEKILSNIQLIDRLGKKFIIRIPFIPGVNDDLETQQQIYTWAAALSHLEWLEILPYHRLGLGKYQALGREYPMGDAKPYRKPELEYLVEVGKALGVNVRIGAK